MADKKISQLADASTPLAGTEVLPIVQSNTTVKVASNDLTVRNVRAAATTGILQVSGPTAGTTRTMTVPDANFTVARTDAANSFTGDQTLSTGNLVVGTSGKGIDFSATPGTGTSELFADYEEGTWTPTISGSSTAGTGTYPARTGTYVKIGSLVTVTAYINISNHTGTGDILLSNLPFTAFATSDVYFPVTIGYLNNCALNANSYPMGFLTFNTTSISLQQNITGGGSMSSVAMDTAFSIMYTITYRVA